jgi:hypothetical protein
MLPAVQCRVSRYKILPVKPFIVQLVQLTVLFLDHLWLLLLLFIKFCIICNFKLAVQNLALLNIDICDNSWHNIIYHWSVLWIIISLSCPLTLRLVFLPIYCCVLRNGVYSFLNPHFPKNKNMHRNQNGIWKHYYKTETRSSAGAEQVGLCSNASCVKLLEQ